MEKLINQMKEERRKLVEENSRLQEFNSQLQLDNASLQEENTELKQRLGINPVNPQLTLELPLSPLSNPPPPPPPLRQWRPPPLSPPAFCNLLSHQNSPMILCCRSRVAD